MQPFTLRSLLPLTLVALLLAACGDTADDTADTTLAPTTTGVETTTTLPPTTTTTAAATTTVASAPVEAKYPVVVTSSLSGDDTQEISVWAPEADGSWPVVYALHGTGGDAQGLAEMATVLAGQGVVVFATDYRSELMSTPQWKDAYRDTECGYRYARSVAANYGGDLDQPVTIVGHSLGATIALAMALNESVFGPDGEFDACPGDTPRPDVVVPLSGCHYEYQGATFDFDPAGMDWTNSEPELVLVVGTEDDVCDPRQSEDAATVLGDEGFDTKLVEVEGGNHSNVVFYEVVDGEWLPVPHDPIGEEVVQISVDAIQGATP